MFKPSSQPHPLLWPAPTASKGFVRARHGQRLASNAAILVEEMGLLRDTAPPGTQHPPV